MAKLRTIAWATLREFLQDRILLVTLAFGLLFLIGSFYLGEVSADQNAKIVADFGLSGIGSLSALCAVFLGASNLAKDFERKTVFIVMSKPIARWQFIAGKFLGLAATLALLVTLMGGMFVAISLLVGALVPGWPLLLLLAWLEAVLLGAVAIFFTLLTAPLLSMVYALGFYLLGHQMPLVKAAAEQAENPLFKTLGLAWYHLFPNLAALDLKHQAVYGLGLNLTQAAMGALYVTGFIVMLLAASAMVFARREF